MKPKIIALLSAITISIFFAFILIPERASAAGFECAVLPDAFCQSADKELDKDERATSSNSGVFMILQWVLAIMTGGIGVVAIAAFVYAGIMYSSASGNAEQVKKAKDIITQTVIGLIVFAAMGIVLIWLIPGGIF